MKVYQLPIDGGILYVDDLDRTLGHLQPELENMEPGEKLEIKVIEMSEAEFAALPEFN